MNSAGDGTESETAGIMRTIRVRLRPLFLVLLAARLASGAAPAESLAVRHPEGLVRGFLFLKSLDGKVIAHGDLIQTSQNDRVTSRLVFHFLDGSLQDETSVYTQKGRFRLVSDHLVQRGPAFPTEMDVKVDAGTGRVTVRYREKDAAEKSIEERMELPDDLANGLPLTLVKNIAPDAAVTTVSMVLATPKPRLVKLIFRRVGKDPFAVGGVTWQATRFQAHIEIGGLTGVLAKLVGKQPPDASVWILEGDAPGFVRSESVFFQDGPLWRIDLASPAWPKESPAVRTPVMTPR